MAYPDIDLRHRSQTRRLGKLLVEPTDNSLLPPFALVPNLLGERQAASEAAHVATSHRCEAHRRKKSEERRIVKPD